MRTFVISYISQSGFIILNDIIHAMDRIEAIQSIENKRVILSCAEALPGQALV